MIRYMILAGLLVMAACKSKTKTETTVTGEKMGMDSIISPGKDTASVIAPADMGKIDLENFDLLKLGQHYSETQEAMAPPRFKIKGH